MRNPGQLTRFKMGSLREILAISLPLMLSLASISIMVFWDRFFLSHLSQAAFSAASEGAMFFIIFEYSLISIAASAEVYVGRFYGAKKDQDVAKPCWAMFWLSLLSAIVLLPIGQWGGYYLFKGSCYPDLSDRFFRSLMYFAPFFGINMALASFWVGRGKTAFVTCVTVFVNLMNIALDPILIFGGFGIPAIGIEGAGIATGLSQVAQTAIYLAVFLNKENRTLFRTHLWKIDYENLIACVKLGWPLMVTICVQACAWSVIARMMSLSGEESLLVWGVIHTAFMLFSFIGDAVGRAGTAIASNFIGAGKTEYIPKMIRSGIRLHITVFSGIFLLFLLFPDTSISIFIMNYDSLSPDLKRILFNAMCWNVLITFFEALLYLWSGILMAMEDSRFLGLTGSILIWILAVIPAAIETTHGATADSVIAATIWYYIGAGVLYLWRYQSHMKNLQRNTSLASPV